MTDDSLPHGARYVDEQGRELITDGGTAAAQGGANLAAAQELEGGAGFNQLAAQSALARAREQGNEELAAQAARQVNSIRANSQLRKDEWKSLDERLVEVAQEQLVIVDDLRSAGLTINEDLGTLLHEFEKTDEFSAADVNMNAETAGGEDSSNFSLHGVPLPIVSKEFHIKQRKLMASRTRGSDLSTVNQAKAARVVSEGLDDLVFNGWSSTFGGEQVYGLTNHPDRNTVSGANWSSSPTVSDIRGDILASVEAIEDDNYGGDLWGYFGRSAYQAMRATDTGTDNEWSVLRRIREEFGDMLDLNMAPTLGDWEAVLFRPVEDVIELAVAADMQNVEWDDGAGMKTHMKVMASITPVLRSDEQNQMGVTHLQNLDT